MKVDSITASYSRKINHDLYGGGAYESSDHFCSMSAVLDDDENAVDVHRQLFTAAKELVGNSVGEEILKIQPGKSWDKFITLLRDYRLGKLELNDEEYLTWSRDQRSVYEEFKKLKRKED